MKFFTFLLQCNMQPSVIKLSINILALCIPSVRHPYVKLLHVLKDLVMLTKIEYYIIKRVSWFKSSLLLRIKTVDITNINS